MDPAARSALIAAVAFGATTLGALAGGSTSILTTPSWLALGFPLPAAIAADKLAGTFWTAVGSRNYLRGRPTDRGLIAAMTGLGVVAAIAGAGVTTTVDPARLTRVVGGVILAVVLVVALRPALGAGEGTGRWPRAAVIAGAVPLGFYEGLLGSGNSIAVPVWLALGLGMDLRRALGHYYAMASGWCATAAIAYFARGAFDVRLALPATAGAVAGGYLGSRLGRVVGPRVGRGIFLAAGSILGLKLLTGW